MGRGATSARGVQAVEGLQGGKRLQRAVGGGGAGRLAWGQVLWHG